MNNKPNVMLGFIEGLKMKKFTVISDSGHKVVIEADMMQQDPSQLSFYTDNILTAVVSYHTVAVAGESDKMKDVN